MSINDLKLVQLFAAKPSGNIQSDTAIVAPILNPDNNDLNHDCDKAGMVDTDHGYRAVVIGLALQLGRENGADSVPDCVLRWLSQAVLEGCPSSKVALDWLYRRRRSAHNEASAFPKALAQNDPSTSTALSEGVIHLAAFVRGGHYD